VEATHKNSKGLYFSANYAWTHSLSDAQGDAPTAFAGETNYGLAVVDRFHISQDRGNVEGTRRQRFLLTEPMIFRSAKDGGGRARRVF